MFFIFLLIVIPGIVLYWMKAASSVDSNGVMVENHMTFFKLLSENMQYRRCAWIIAAAAEFQNMALRKGDQQELTRLRRDLKDMIPPMNAKKQYPPRFIKNLLLLFAHMTRRPLSPVLAEDQKLILEKAGSLLETAIEQGFAMSMNPRMKRVGLKTLVMLIEYAQLLTQGMTEHEQSVFMLPHVNDGNVKDIPKDRQSVEKLRGMPLPEKFAKKLSPDQIEDVKAALSYLPRYSLKSEAYVPDVTDSTDGPRDIAEGDLITIKVAISRLGQEGEPLEAGMVHSHRFPWRKTEKLWLIIGDIVTNRVFYVKKINSVEAVIEDVDFKFLAGSKVPPFGIGAGEHSFDIIVKSDSYYGLDAVEKVTFKIVEENKVTKEVFIHEDDKRLDNEPTLIQQLIMGGKPEEKESDDEELPELAAGVEEVPEEEEEDID